MDSLREHACPSCTGESDDGLWDRGDGKDVGFSNVSGIDAFPLCRGFRKSYSVFRFVSMRDRESTCPATLRLVSSCAPLGHTIREREREMVPGLDKRIRADE
ncbi:hypothetical protein ACJRO7_019338 [Eucalyptus globulus]|uniref:Uncharacterized protein n=1 Tax=Eucalyptus globulus TaxID=34317 RepID=A0ABD3KJK6_EUCGL